MRDKILPLLSLFGLLFGTVGLFLQLFSRHFELNASYKQTERWQAAYG